MKKRNILTGINLRAVANKSGWPNIILAVTLFAATFGALISTKTLITINKNIAAAKEEARPANIKLTKITVPNCQNCFDLDSSVADFKKLNVKIEEEKTLDFNSVQADPITKQLSIKKVPTYIATGEVTKKTIENFVKVSGEIRDNTFIFTKLTPVFIDTETGQEIGNVEATLITDSSCLLCTDPKAMVEKFKKAGVKISSVREFAWNSFEGQNLISRFKIAKVPTFIFSPGFDLYDRAKSSWQNFGTVESDKTYVVRNLPLPYRDLTKEQIVGLVDAIYLTDSSCPNCYKVSEVQKPIVTSGFGVALRFERTVDVLSGEGRRLVNQYQITKVPTILLSPEADGYINLKNVWQKVGTVEKDGWYVFRQMQQLRGAVYKDLETGQTVGAYEK